MPLSSDVLFHVWRIAQCVLHLSYASFVRSRILNLWILTFPDFESLTCGSHHMPGPDVSERKSGIAKSEDPIPICSGCIIECFKPLQLGCGIIPSLLKNNELEHQSFSLHYDIFAYSCSWHILMVKTPNWVSIHNNWIQFVDIKLDFAKADKESQIKRMRRRITQVLAVT
jgi:hypothetical protein